MSRLNKLLMLCTVLSFSTICSAKFHHAVGNWTISCTDHCVASQTLASKDMSLKFAVTLSKLGNADALALRFDLPLGMYLPPGLGIVIGDLKFAQPYTTCLPKGCKVFVLLDENVINTMLIAEMLNIRFFRSETTSEEVSFSLYKFAEVLENVNS